MPRIAMVSSVLVGLVLAAAGCSSSSAPEPTAEEPHAGRGAARSAADESVTSVQGIYWCKGANQCIIDTSYVVCSQACRAAGLGDCVFTRLPPC